MKKLAFLFIGTYLLVACDATPGGNKAIMPVEHEEAVEHVDHDAHGDHAAHGEEAHQEAQEGSTEKKDTIVVETTEANADHSDHSH